jgi:hypothetical protein
LRSLPAFRGPERATRYELITALLFKSVICISRENVGVTIPGILEFETEVNATTGDDEAVD